MNVKTQCKPLFGIIVAIAMALALCISGIGTALALPDESETETAPSYNPDYCETEAGKALKKLVEKYSWEAVQDIENTSDDSTLTILKITETLGISPQPFVVATIENITGYGFDDNSWLFV